MSIKKIASKEMVVDFRIKSDHSKISIKGTDVERVDCYKYLGVLIDKKFCFDEHSNYVYTKANQKLFYLRQLHKVKVDKTILSLFFSSVVQSSLTYCMCAWYGNCTNVQKKNWIKL